MEGVLPAEGSPEVTGVNVGPLLLVLAKVDEPGLLVLDAHVGRVAPERRVFATSPGIPMPFQPA